MLAAYLLLPDSTVNYGVFGSYLSCDSTARTDWKMKALLALFVTLLLSLSAMGQDDPYAIIDTGRIDSVPASPGDRIDIFINHVNNGEFRGLTVADLRWAAVGGQLVRTLVDKRIHATYYELTWDGRDQSDRAATSGIYSYRLEAQDFSKTRKMMLIKQY